MHSWGGWGCYGWNGLVTQCICGREDVLLIPTTSCLTTVFQHERKSLFMQRLFTRGGGGGVCWSLSWLSVGQGRTLHLFIGSHSKIARKAICAQCGIELPPHPTPPTLAPTLPPPTQLDLPIIPINTGTQTREPNSRGCRPKWCFWRLRAP